MRKKPVAHASKSSQADVRAYFQQYQSATLSAKKYIAEKQGKIASILVGFGYLIARVQIDPNETDNTSFFIVNLPEDRNFFKKVSRLAQIYDWDDFVLKSPGVDMEELLRKFAAKKRLKYIGK
ncbi:MAG: hypothetical protein HQL15_10145 [Candidatus Omnitrophica bacterium]|nr:hypothetical protein [Candidatus Omnitrophota bacterium]